MKQWQRIPEIQMHKINFFNLCSIVAVIPMLSAVAKGQRHLRGWALPGSKSEYIAPEILQCWAGPGPLSFWSSGLLVLG